MIRVHSPPEARPGEVPPEGRWRLLLDWGGPVIGVLLALWLVSPVIGARPPAGEDVTAHLVRADFGISQLVNHGRLDGWFPRFVLGHAEFLFNGPGLTWAIAAIRALTLGALSNAGALKVVTVVAFAATPPAVAFVARSYGLSRRVAGLAAILSLLVSNRYGPGLHGLYGVGLVSHQLGAVFFWLALGAGLRSVSDRRPRWVLLAAGSSAALLVTHLISVMVLAVVLGLSLAALAVVRRLPAAGLARLAVAGMTAAGLAGFWLVPFLAHRDLGGIVVTWGTPDLLTRLGAVVRGRHLLPTGFALVIGAAALAQLTHLRRHPVTLAWLATPVAYLLVAHGAIEVAPNDVTMQLANRGLGYAATLAVLAVAVAAARASSRFGPAGYAVALGVAVLAVALGAPGRDVAGQLPEPRPALRAAAAELAARVPDGARFATERDFPAEIRRTGVIHPEIWLAWASGRNTLNGFNIEASPSPFAGLEPSRLGKRSPTVAARRMARFGVTHVVATTSATARKLTASGGFNPVWRRESLTVLEVAPRPGGPAPGSLLSAGAPMTGRLVDPRTEHLSFDVNPERATAVTVAVAWSPKWHGRIDGRSVSLERTGDGLIRYRAPAGSHRLTLDYRSDGWDRAGAVLTVITAAGLLVAARAGRRRQLMSRIFSRTA